MRSRIYLMAEPGLAAEVLAGALDAAGTAGATDVACVLLRTGGADDDAVRAAIAALRPAAQEREVAFLIEDRARLADETGCDGVHLTGDAKALRAARAAVGADAIVGATCGGSRHAAMLAAEVGADYVAFGDGPAERWWQGAADPEIVSWWQAIMTAPCVALAGDDLATAGVLAAAGADFVALGAGIWAHPDGPDAALRALQAMLAEAEAAGAATERTTD